MKSRINALDSVTVNKIAAGEVIDRPLSIVKELIENAIDAGASRIHITLKEGGKQLIRISDNGHGIYKDDLKKAVLRHATSKISSLEDLYQSSSFGFRGEALASICHCAQLKISSKSEQDEAYFIEAFQDQVSEVQPCTHPQGTSIEVKDLFFNIPVRQNFLKTASTEASHCIDICIQFALTHPDIDFILSSDDVEKVNTTGISDLKALIVLLYGKNLKDHLVPVDEQIGPVFIKGMISAPTTSFANRTKQIIAVNSRLVKNALIQKSILDSYRDIIPQRRFPLAILNIRLENTGLDVNIHPQKQDIKFMNPGFIFDAIPKALSLALQRHTAHTDVIQDQVSPQHASPFIQAQAPTLQAHEPAFRTGTAVSPVQIQDKSTAQFAATEQAFQSLSTPETQQASFLSDQQTAPLEYLQLFNTYIVLKSSEGMYMIDQHAVHERILYEKIKENFAKEQARQLLLMPEMIDLSADLMQVFNQEHGYLKDLNFICESFGPSQIIVREIPLLFQKASVTDLITDILQQLKEAPSSTRSMTLEQKDRLQRQACRAAIKAGQALSEQEVRQLLKDFMASPQNYTCPHGRPLFIHYDKNKLESLFMRI